MQGFKPFLPRDAIYAVVVCLSVCLFVTSQCFTVTAKRRITQTTPHDSPWGLKVFWCRRSRQNSNGVTPNGGAKCTYGRLKLATFDKPLAVAQNVDRRKRCQLSSVGSLSHWASTFVCSTFAV